jgi:hypothetical protein
MLAENDQLSDISDDELDRDMDDKGGHTLSIDEISYDRDLKYVNKAASLTMSNLRIAQNLGRSEKKLVQIKCHEPSSRGKIVDPRPSDRRSKRNSNRTRSRGASKEGTNMGVMMDTSIMQINRSNQQQCQNPLTSMHNSLRADATPFVPLRADAKPFVPIQYSWMTY